MRISVRPDASPQPDIRRSIVAVDPFQRDHPMPTLNARPSSVTGTQLRAAASHFPTGVAIVSARLMSAANRSGARSVRFSVSLEPPIVAVSLAQSTSTLAHLVANRQFGISVLSSSQGGVAEVFASREVDHAERFAGIRWRHGQTGVPVLDNGLSTIECDIHDIVPAGDHYLVLGRVVSLFASGWEARSSTTRDAPARSSDNPQRRASR